MATPYEKVYGRFLNKCSDFNLADLDDYTLEEMMKDWLHSAIIRTRTSSDLSARDDEVEEFVIPVYTDEEEANAAIEMFKEQFGENEFVCDKKIGHKIISEYSEDEQFIGLAINAPQWDFVIGGEDVHECCE